MFILYSDSDVVPTASAPGWIDQTISTIKHKRTDIEVDSSWEAGIKAVDGYKQEYGAVAPRTLIYRHYVPYKRIFNALQESFMGKKRREIAEFLLGPKAFKSDSGLLANLHITAPQWLVNLGDPFTSRLAFDAQVDWAVAAVCYWQNNVFYGTGEGDRKGTTLDIPTTPGPGIADKQTVRVVDAAKTLKLLIPNLSLDAFVSVEKYGRAYETISEKNAAYTLIKTAQVEEEKRSSKKRRIELVATPFADSLIEDDFSMEDAFMVV